MVAFCRVGFLEAKMRLGHLQNHRIDLHRLDPDLRIIMLERTLHAPAAQANRQNAGDPGVPQPGHVKELGVFKVPLQRIRQRHLRLHRIIKTQGPDPPVIQNTDMVVGRGRLIHQPCSETPGAQTVSSPPKTHFNRIRPFRPLVLVLRISFGFRNSVFGFSFLLPCPGRHRARPEPRIQPQAQHRQHIVKAPMSRKIAEIRI